MSYHKKLDHFFKQRAESFNLNGINIDMNSKQSYVHSNIECEFKSLPKDAKWVDNSNLDYNDSSYVSSSNESEYDFHGKIELHFINFNYDYSYIPEVEIEKFKEYMNGNEDLGDWDIDFHDHWVMNNSTTPYQFSKGKYSIDGKEFEDYLILNHDFYSEDYGDNVFEVPFNGVNSMVNYKGYQIFHPSENKFVPVSLICTGSYLHDQLNLDIVFNDKKQLKKLAEIFDGSSEFRYATDVADYLTRLKSI